MRQVWSSVWVVCAVMLSGCKSEGVSSSAPAIARIIVSPEAPVISVGGSVQLSAVGKGFDDEKGFVWRTSNPTVLHVSEAGLVTGIGPGSALILTKAAFDTTLEATTRIAVH